MSMFGDGHEQANELYDQLAEMVDTRGLAYTLEYLGRCLVNASPSPCLWEETLAGDWIVWETSCAEAFILTEGMPEENSYRYCPSCGRPILLKMRDLEEET